MLVVVHGESCINHDGDGRAVLFAEEAASGVHEHASNKPFGSGQRVEIITSAEIATCGKSKVMRDNQSDCKKVTFVSLVTTENGVRERSAVVDGATDVAGGCQDCS